MPSQTFKVNFGAFFWLKGLRYFIWSVPPGGTDGRTVWTITPYTGGGLNPLVCTFPYHMVSDSVCGHDDEYTAELLRDFTRKTESDVAQKARVVLQKRNNKPQVQPSLFGGGE